jgi:hypothetical protein
MKVSGYTKQERSLLTFIRILMVLFFLAALLFIIAPSWTLNYLSAVGRGIFGFREPPLILGQEHFWLVLAIAYLSALTYICFIAQNDFLRNMDYMVIVIFSKLVSAIGFTVCFFRFDYRFFYLVGILVDGLIFLLTWYYYNAAKKSRAR